MAWYDDLENIASGTGNMLLDAGKFAGKAALAYKAPAMYNALMESENRARNQQERQAFNKQYIGQAEIPFSQQQSSNPDGRQSMSIQEPQRGSGVLGGGMTPMQKIIGLLDSPDAITRTGANAMLRDQMAPKKQSQMKTILGGVEGNPKGRQHYGFDASNNPYKLDIPAYNAGATTEVNINPAKEYIKAGTTLIDDQGNKVRVPINMTKGDAAAQGLYYGNKQSDESVKSEAAQGVSLDMLNDLEGIYRDGGDITGMPGFLTDLRSGNDIWGVAANELLNKAGMPLSEKKAKATSLARSISSQLIQAMRGAAVGPEEERMFQKQLPVPGQPDKLFESNLMLTRQNLLKLMEKKKDLTRGVDSNQGADEPNIINWEDL